MRKKPKDIVDCWFFFSVLLKELNRNILIIVTRTWQHAILSFYRRWNFEILHPMFYQLFQRWSESDRVRGIIQPWRFRPCHLPGSVCEWPALSVVSPQPRWLSVPPVHVGRIDHWMWRVSILHQTLLTRSAN